MCIQMKILLESGVSELERGRLGGVHALSVPPGATLLPEPEAGVGGRGSVGCAPAPRFCVGTDETGN